MSSDARTREILDSLADALFVLDRDSGAILDANARATALFGRPRGELIGRSLGEVVAGVELEGHDDLRAKVVSSSNGQEVFEWACRDRAGREFWSEVTLTRTRLSNEDLVLAEVRDITRRKLVEGSLRESRTFLEKAQEIGRIGSWIASLGSDDHLVWSKEIFRIFGLPEDQKLSVTLFYDCVHPDDRGAVRSAVQHAIEEHHPYEIEHRIVRPDKSERWVLERADVEYDAQGIARRLIGVVQDITERKQAEEALLRKEELLRQAQKMEAIGRLAGGIAHDFNNMLTAIGGYTSIGLAQTGLAGPARECLEEIRKANERAASLTRQLLAFSRKQVLQPRVIDLNEIVREMQSLLQRLIGENIDFELKLERALWPVRADPGQFEQVLANLIVNARDAMPHGGRLRVQTSNLELGPDAARARGELEPGRYVQFTVADTGVGMDPETRAHLFEPFFTTKEAGQGTGLGLSTVYGIVRQSGGTVEVDSALGRGSEFRILLPRADRALELRPPPGIAQGEGPRGRETVLVVEDDASVRELARLVLVGRGYTVLSARDGAEALEVCTEHPGEIHLMLSDLVMPRMSGTELWKRAAILRPKMRVLFMSGYADGQLGRPGTPTNTEPYIEKPFTPLALAREARRVLDSAVTA